LLTPRQFYRVTIRLSPHSVEVELRAYIPARCSHSFTATVSRDGNSTETMDFRETELFFYDWPHSLQLDRMDCTPKNGDHFDLDLGVSLANKDEGSVRVGVVGDDAVRDRFANLLGNTIQRRSYPHERCLSIVNREVHQTNVHREAGEVSNETIDSLSHP
jgi:hypothetical protein